MIGHDPHLALNRQHNNAQQKSPTLKEAIK